MRNFNTGFGHDFGLTTMGASHGYAYGSRARIGSERGIPLSQLSRRRNETDSPTAFVSGLAPGGRSYETEVSRGTRNSGDTGKSQELIIRKDVTTTVQHQQWKNGQWF